MWSCDRKPQSLDELLPNLFSRKVDEKNEELKSTGKGWGFTGKGEEFWDKSEKVPILGEVGL